MNGIDYEVNVVLSDMMDVCVRDIETDSGDLKRCICLPIEDNGFRKTNKNKVIMRLIAKSKKFTRGQSHYLQSIWTKEKYSLEADRGYFPPIVGHLIPRLFIKKDKRNDKNKLTLNDF